MGYRSHVLFAITEPEDVAIRLQDPKIASLLTSADRKHTKHWSNDTLYYIYEWDHVKWYDSDEEVKALSDWMDDQELLDEDEYGFMFLRDGEEINDLEHKGSWNYGLTYGIGIEDDNTPRLTDTNRKAIAGALDMIEGEWGKYMDDDLKQICETLRTMI